MISCRSLLALVSCGICPDLFLRIADSNKSVKFNFTRIITASLLHLSYWSALLTILIIIHSKSPTNLFLTTSLRRTMSYGGDIPYLFPTCLDLYHHVPSMSDNTGVFGAQNHGRSRNPHTLNTFLLQIIEPIPSLVAFWVPPDCRLIITFNLPVELQDSIFYVEVPL